MKFILILACLALYVAHAQGQRCRGRIPLQQAICSGPKDEGHRLLRQCRRNANANMWWYDRSDRTCKKLAYRGCDGNRNRYCSLADCQKKCRR